MTEQIREAQTITRNRGGAMTWFRSTILTETSCCFL